LTDGNRHWVKVFAVLVILVMTVLNVLGSEAVARVQTLVVIVVIGILTVFAISTLANLHPHLLAPSGYPKFSDILASVALTFFAFLGFGVITFTAKDLENPGRQLPRAVYLALGIATCIYLAVALGVFGTLTVEKVIDSGGTALAVAAQPVLGRAGYWLMTVTALFATSGATNAGLYPATGICDQMVATGQFPPPMAHRFGARMSAGLLLTAAISIVLAIGFDLNAIASIGSAVALVIFALVTAGHMRVRGETGAKLWVLALGVLTTSVVLVSFVVTTLVHEPKTSVTLLVILAVSIGADLWWKRTRGDRPVIPAQPSPGGVSTPQGEPRGIRHPTGSSGRDRP